MKFIPVLFFLSAAILPFLAPGGAVTVTYDPTYDNSALSLNSTACSDGANGLVSKWPTLGNVPNFANVGGIPGLTWNSTLCGTCWQLQFVDTNGTNHTTVITAVDAARTFNIAKSVFTSWAGNAAVTVGSVNANAAQVAPSQCKIN